MQRKRAKSRRAKNRAADLESGQHLDRANEPRVDPAKGQPAGLANDLTAGRKNLDHRQDANLLEADRTDGSRSDHLAEVLKRRNGRDPEAPREVDRRVVVRKSQSLRMKSVKAKMGVRSQAHHLESTPSLTERGQGLDQEACQAKLQVPNLTDTETMQGILTMTELKFFYNRKLCL